jgi:hypothetical protein
MTGSIIIALSVAVTASIIIIHGITAFNESHAQKLSSEQKAAFCDPNNPRLKFVNITESKICGIPSTPLRQSSMNQTNGTLIPSTPPNTPTQ